jgi:hypothetical protein
MPLSLETVMALKGNLKKQRDILMKVAELEEQWPETAEGEEEIKNIPVLIRAEQEWLLALDTVTQAVTLPAKNWEDSLSWLPPAERPGLEQELKTVQGLTAQILKRHQQNAGLLNLQVEKTGKALQSLQQEKAFVQALRQTTNQTGQFNLVG